MNKRFILTLVLLAGFLCAFPSVRADDDPKKDAKPFEVQLTSFHFSSNVDLKSGNVQSNFNANVMIVVDSLPEYAGFSTQLEVTDVIDENENNLLDKENQIADAPRRDGGHTIFYGSDRNRRNYRFLTEADFANKSRNKNFKQRISAYGYKHNLKALPSKIKAVAGHVYGLKIKKSEPIDMPLAQAGAGMEMKGGGVTFTLKDLDQKGKNFNFKLEFDSTKGIPTDPDGTSPFLSKVVVVDDAGGELEVGRGGSSWSSSGNGVAKGNFSYRVTLKSEQAPTKVRLYYVTEYTEDKIPFEFEP